MKERSNFHGPSFPQIVMLMFVLLSSLWNYQKISVIVFFSPSFFYILVGFTGSKLLLNVW